MPISYSGCYRLYITSIHHYFIFVGLQRSIGHQKCDFYTFKIIVIKKTDHQKKSLDLERLIIDHFYLLISLEEMASFIQSVSSYSQILGRPST